MRGRLRLGRVLFAGLFICVMTLAGQSQSGRPAGSQSSKAAANLPKPRLQSQLAAWQGKTVARIEFEGVRQERLDPLQDDLAQQPKSPLKTDDVRESLRRLFASGLYDTISADGRLEGDEVVLVFRGQPRTFIGTVNVIGAKGANMNSLLERASRLTPGTRFTSASLAQAEVEMRKSLVENGFHEPSFTHTLTPHPDEQRIDISYKVDSGPQAKTGAVAVAGESGLTESEFRHDAKLKEGRKVDRETVGNALEGVVKRYRKQQRLEADVKLESQEYVTARKQVDFKFSATRGPVVHVLVDGVSLSQGRVKKLVPVYEEGTVDEDLLNEGNRRLQNYYQRLGYFDAKVTHEQKPPTADLVEIVFHVQRGARHRVGHVYLSGAKYFDLPTLEERLSVRKHDAFDRQGIYNQSLVNADVSSIQAIYQNNGFSAVKVTPEIQDGDNGGANGGQAAVPAKGKYVELNVVYHVDEGQQQRVHSVQLEGAEKIQTEPLTAILNTAVGQPLSPESLGGDRDTLLTYYLSKGFDQARVELTQSQEDGDPSQVNIVFRIQEGEQVFLRNILITGLHYTRMSTVQAGITLKPGDPLNQTALLDTQRNLYDLTVFNEVDPVIQNPTGVEPRKTVLLQTTEARRWDLSYGLGFEVQTGTVNGSTQNNPNGSTGASPRVLFDVSRINLFGRQQSLSLRTTYGLLEQRVNLLYQYPHIHGSKNFGISVSGGYNNSQDVTTYSASKLEASVRLTEHFNGEGQLLSKANTFIYQFIFRRVKVDEGSAQIPQNEIPLLFQAVRVGGPSFNWIRDTRDTPLDAHRGTYTSFQEFIASSKFASGTNFNQVDISNSSYYRIDKDKIVLARNTRYGQERAFGDAAFELIPLPERLYGGGGTSHRGFGVNSAGPRDPQTGFPIGGAGVFVNTTELRLPPPTLPVVGKTVSFVPFHDMGNVFTNASDIWASILRFRQQDRAGCRNLTPGTPTGPDTSTGQQGTCTFNYFSHAVGMGLRYGTPVGPIRVDFSYNLNPPIYPVTYDAVKQINLVKPYVGEGAHFNFFFSLGQSF
jgi:outer membrane protein insertion porin family